MNEANNLFMLVHFSGKIGHVFRLIKKNPSRRMTIMVFFAQYSLSITVYRVGSRALAKSLATVFDHVHVRAAPLCSQLHHRSTWLIYPQAKSMEVAAKKVTDFGR